MVTMADQYGSEFTGCLKSSNLDEELKPIAVGIDRMLLRLEEFENLLELIKLDSSVALTQNIPAIAALKPEFNDLCERIDRLERFIAMVGRNLDAVERQVQIAEEELDIPDKTINVLLKSLNIFGKPKPAEKLTNRNAAGTYEPTPVFRSEQFFQPIEKGKRMPPPPPQPEVDGSDQDSQTPEK